MPSIRVVLATALVFQATISALVCAPLPVVAKGGAEKFFSELGREHEVMFDAVYRTQENNLNIFQAMSEVQRQSYAREHILPVMDFLFGPLTHRQMGSPQRTQNIEVNWSQMRLNEGKIELPYRYTGTWIIERSVAGRGRFDIPVPLNEIVVFSSGWRQCGDNDPAHQTRSFYWYFWDPERAGCDQTLGQDYLQATVLIGRQTVNQARSFPEYQRMLDDQAVHMTIAFGYVKDSSNPAPETDYDYGARQYREFTQAFRKNWGAQLQETAIPQSEYRGGYRSNLVIGHRFAGTLSGMEVRVNIVIAAAIDQMDLFAQSYAHDHDDIFAWFGHSRVGSGFDADRFRRMLTRDPAYFSVSSKYQLVYWGGCNSYSYYTLPFFELKARAANGQDPNGTKNLDIIANGLPALFSLNARNALVTANTFLNWDRRTSYQELIKRLEYEARGAGVIALVAVLGDEDNVEGAR